MQMATEAYDGGHGHQRASTSGSVGKRTGGAVVRNRIRRRLRAALRDLHGRGALPRGTYLVGGRRELADQPWPELVRDLETAVAQATQPAGASS